MNWTRRAFLGGALTLPATRADGLHWKRGAVISWWAPAVDDALRFAIRDLATDLDTVLSARLIPAETAESASLIVINLQKGSWPGLSIRPGEWERYEISVRGRQVVIAGSDQRGTLFGIYQFSRLALGVDPLHFWIPERPRLRNIVNLLNAVGTSDTPTFRYRGWFINDEDFLQAWSYGTYRETIDYYGVQRKTISYEVYEKLIATMLRLRINMIIPATVIDIHDPQHAEIFKRIQQRGLLFSQHHIEPVGVGPSYAFRNFCRRRGLDPNFSWTHNRPVVEACWRHYIDRIAEFGDSVIWQLGYRGSGDRPFWETEREAPQDFPGRARIISDAIQRQYDMIVERVGSSSRVVCSTTLWWEGNMLYARGLLRLPPGVIVVVSDVGRTQMLPDPMPCRERGRPYGLYYHAGYWSTGPHLIQGNAPSNVISNYRRAIAAGANVYSVQNVANFRPFLPVIQVVAELTWDARSFQDDLFLGDFCERQFGNRSIQNLIREYYAAFVHRSEPALRQGNSRWLDGALVLMIRTVLSAMDKAGGANVEAYRLFMQSVGFRLQLLQNNPPINDLVDSRDPATWMCDGWTSLCGYMLPLLLQSERRWDRLATRINNRRHRLLRGRTFYDSNIYWQVLLGRSLTSAACRCFEGLRTLQNGSLMEGARRFRQAADILEGVVRRGSELAEQLHFAKWTRGDQLVNLPSIAERLRVWTGRLSSPVRS